MARYFQVLSPRPQIEGNYILDADASGNFYNGQCAALQNNSGVTEWIKPNGTAPAFGLFYDQGLLVEELYDRVGLADEQLIDMLKGSYVGVVTGDFTASMSVDYFNAGPTPGALIYDAEDGTLTTVSTGHAQVGVCLGTNTVEGSTTVYEIRFHFGGALGVG